MFVRSSQSKGFSLIEVLVSLSIFTVVVTICVSVLYALIEANARSRNTQSVVTNLAFTLDSMTREIRTGSDFFCADNEADLPYGENDYSTQDCLNGGDVFSFNEGGQSLTGNTPNDSRRIAYRLLDGKLQRRLGSGNSASGSANEAADWLDLTADDTVINKLHFYVEGSHRLFGSGGSGSSDDLSPIVTIYLSGEVGDEDTERQEFSIQTTITQRLLDV